MSELNFLQAIILSVIQAITEFIPVSSSAHLLLPSKLLGWPDQGQFFDISVHFGSLVAVILHFRDSLLSRNFYTSNFFLLLIVATIPIIAFTLIFNGITDLRWSLTSIAISNILFAFLLLISTKINVKNTNKKDLSIDKFSHEVNELKDNFKKIHDLIDFLSLASNTIDRNKISMSLKKILLKSNDLMGSINNIEKKL